MTELSTFYSIMWLNNLKNVIYIDHNNVDNTNREFDKINRLENVILLVSQCPFVIHSVAAKFIKHINIPFVIVTAINDYTFPQELKHVNSVKRIIYHKHFKHWFAVNKSITNDKHFTSIPYGLDYWTVTKTKYFSEEIQTVEEQNNKLINISKKTIHFTNRIPLIYANFHLKMTVHLNNEHTDGRHGSWRGRLHTIIPPELIYFEPEKLPRTESWEKMSLYSFVLSPLGNGLDCIRTFEALCLRCIVIIPKSSLDTSMYSDLPVLIVNDYSEINKKLLNDTLELFSQKKFNYDKLYMNYWLELVNQKFT